MARAAAAAAAVCLFLAVAFANTSDLPPVDQDGSGDDDDSFSGSGFEPLLEEELAHNENADKPTDASLTSAVPYVPTESKHPMVVEPESPEEKEADIVSTTSAVVTELIPSPVQQEQDVHIPDEETATDKGSAVLVPTTGSTVQPDTIKMDVPHAVLPEVHNIPQDLTTESVRHATDPKVHLSHHDGTSTTQAIEPHRRHPHHHHHHHHHNHTTAASVTEAVDTDLHHVPHHVTSAPSVTHSLDPHLHPAVQEDISPTSAVDSHMDHPHDAEHVTESNVELHSTPDDNLLEDSIGETTVEASHDDSKTNIPAVVFDTESEPEHTDSPEVEASGGGIDTNDFVFEPAIPRNNVPDNKIAMQEDGMSDTSKGIMEQKGVLAAVIAGGVAGLVLAVCLVGFMLYRMKKKDEGSYCLEETKQTNGGYEKPLKQEEFYA